MEPASFKQTDHDLYNLIGETSHMPSGDIKHRHYFRIAGITVCVENFSLPGPVKFKKELMAFATGGPGDDNITLRHHFFLPDLKGRDLGVEVYRRAPWVIYKKNGSWIYKGILPMGDDDTLHHLAIFISDYTRSLIFSPTDTPNYIRKNGFRSLSLLPTDQIWLIPLLAERNAVLLHSAAASINGLGFIFVGHSDAGKSTTIELLEEAKQNRGLDVEVLCDDRNVIRRWQHGWHVHGTWSHGDIDHVSPAGAPLKGIFFLKQAAENRIVPLSDRKLIWKNLLATLVRAMVTTNWWQQELDILDQLINDVACYSMFFDKSGSIVTELERLTK